MIWARWFIRSCSRYDPNSRRLFKGDMEEQKLKLARVFAEFIRVKTRSQHFLPVTKKGGEAVIPGVGPWARAMRRIMASAASITHICARRCSTPFRHCLEESTTTRSAGPGRRPSTCSPKPCRSTRAETRRRWRSQGCSTGEGRETAAPQQQASADGYFDSGSGSGKDQLSNFLNNHRV